MKAIDDGGYVHGHSFVYEWIIPGLWGVVNQEIITNG